MFVDFTPFSPAKIVYIPTYEPASKRRAIPQHRFSPLAPHSPGGSLIPTRGYEGVPASRCRSSPRPSYLLGCR